MLKNIEKERDDDDDGKNPLIFIPQDSSNTHLIFHASLTH